MQSHKYLETFTQGEIMAIHTGGKLNVHPTDLQITHAGKKVALKLIQWGGEGGIPVICGIQQMPNGDWEVTGQFTEYDDIFTPEAAVAKAGGVRNYIVNVLVPLINEWLARVFPPTGVTTPAPVAPGDSIFVQLDKTIPTILAWDPKADGTLQIKVK